MNAARDAGCARALGPVDDGRGLVERSGEIAGFGRRDILQNFERADDFRRDRGGAFAGMRIGAVCALGTHGELEP